jgi:hypothetical protein
MRGGEPRTGSRPAETSGQQPPAVGTITSMNKLAASLLILFVLFIVSFGTWQLFLGNLEAAFSSFFFLMIIYLFVKPLRK